MARSRLRLCLTALLGLLLLQGCATNHLMRWSSGEESIYKQPDVNRAPFIHPAGTFLALPVTLVWDIVTYPFQWIWGVYPSGEALHPDRLDKV